MEPEKALTWVVGLPNTKESSDALDNVVRTWAAVSPTNLTKWVEQQPAGPDADRIRTDASEMIVENEPLKALDIASKITDPNALIDRINLLMLNNTMTSAQRSALMAAITAITNADPATQARRRTQTALYIVGASPAFQTDR